jgi:hypothetical protein
MACTFGKDNETHDPVKVAEILDQNFGFCVLKKDAAPWSKCEDIPVHTLKACGEADEYLHSVLTSAEGGESGRSTIRPSTNEEAPAYPLDMKLSGIQSLS